jgi:hypothetical protein
LKDKAAGMEIEQAAELEVRWNYLLQKHNKEANTLLMNCGATVRN